MSCSSPQVWLAWMVAAAFAPGSLPLHDDDPKIVDRQPTYRRAKLQHGGFSGAYAPGGGGGGGFQRQEVDLLAWMTCTDFGAQMVSGNDCWGYVSPSGREYALMGLSHGTAFVNVTLPRNPVIVAVIAGPASLWRDLKVYQAYAYAVSEGGDGIQVIDMTQIDAGVVTLVNTITSGGSTTATHTVAIDTTSGFLYRAGGGGHGLRIYDLANPADPVHVGSWDTRYVHETQVVTYTEGPYQGKQIAYCFSGYNGGWTQPGVNILDVTDKANVVLVQEILYSGAAYSHQGWLTPDWKYLYIGDELDEYWQGIPTTTVILDVSVLGQAFEAGSFTNGNQAIGHNMYSLGKQLFQANYRSGLRVFDITDPLHAVETHWFDTYPTDDAPAFNSLWSCYPYLPSGTIIGSDIEKGMFLWRLERPRLLFDYPRALPHLVDPVREPVEFRVREGSGQLLAGSVELHVDRGNGFETFGAHSSGAPRFEVRFPPAPIGTPYAYYFSARTTTGETIQDPVAAPAEVYRARAGEFAQRLFADDFEQERGWTLGSAGDTATAGGWERTVPEATPAQPGADHSKDPGARCCVTGAAAGSSAGANDVDGGTTTLVSPALDLSGADVPVVSYWRWFSNDRGLNPAQDTLAASISNDDGATWTPVETVGPNDGESSGGWFFYEFLVSDFVAPTARVRVRFVADDGQDGSVVEAALDDFEVIDLRRAGDVGGNGRRHLR